MKYEFPLLPIVSDADEAKDVAIAWQQWQSEKSLSMTEMLEWQNYFIELANKYGLTDEFTENGII